MNSIKVIKENLNRVKADIELACKKTGRDPQAVKIVLVTKRVDVPIIELLADLNITDIGENKVQDAVRKYSSISKKFNWHMIGHLQTNKVKKGVEIFSTIHSIGSEKLAAKLDQELEQAGKTIDGFIQVDFTNNPQRSGVDPNETVKLVNIIKNSHKRINLKGLMTLPPLYENIEKTRLIFKELNKLKETCSLEELSMGMSNDFVEAVEQGATIVRIGTRIFEGIAS